MRQTRKVVVMKAKYDYDAKEDNELSFKRGDILLVDYVVGNKSEWVRGQTNDGKEGLVPTNFVESCNRADDEELKQAEKEEKEKKEKEERERREQEEKEKKEKEERERQERERREREERERKEEKEERERQARKEDAEAEVDDDDVEILVRALYDYKATEEGELTFKKGDIIKLLERDDEGGWWIGDLNGNLLPSSSSALIQPKFLRLTTIPSLSLSLSHTHTHTHMDTYKLANRYHGALP